MEKGIIVVILLITQKDGEITEPVGCIGVVGIFFGLVENSHMRSVCEGALAPFISFPVAYIPYTDDDR